ncbi:hypothetical protein EVAR_61229_1 [Eumeta japonica]|uniref:Uncharacterized protein n=1 Tax=Eumeta variegata TaxID=151549 RepID=A0A4C1ZAI6_EUMVA|nr:hypothetical protein EVAR_61229_1 [Eumeta japonica]
MNVNKIKAMVFERRKSMVISELLTARRTAITVWISSPSDEGLAVAVARGGIGGARRLASLYRPGAVPGGCEGLLPYGLWRVWRQSGRRVFLLTLGPRAFFDPTKDQTFDAARFRMTVGGPVAIQLAAVALPGTAFLVWGLHSDTREAPHMT